MLDYPHLETLLAIEEQGSFESAASYLGVSKPAISQKIRLLDQRLGEPTVDRNSVALTIFGKQLCRHLKDVCLLESILKLKHADMFKGMQVKMSSVSIAIHRNIETRCFFDHLETQLAQQSHFLFDIVAINGEDVLEGLQNQVLTGAISSQCRTIHGYRRYELGTIPFRAVCNQDLSDRFFAQGLTPQSACEVLALIYSDDDPLLNAVQHKFFGRNIQQQTYPLPSLHGLIRKTKGGAGWSILPEHMIRSDLNNETLVDLGENHSLDIPLYWYVSAELDDVYFEITKTILEAAEAMNTAIIAAKTKPF